ncbi:MAG: hypothetical protein AAF483_11960 [Planctomycetota bacterium]
MKRRNAILGALVPIAIGGPLASANAQEKENEEQDSRKQLLLQRSAVLQERVELIQFQYDAGGVSLEKLIKAQNEYLLSQLDLRDTRAAKMELLLKRFRGLQQLEEIASKKHEAGVTSLDEVLYAKACRLEAQIALLDARNE